MAFIFFWHEVAWFCCGQFTNRAKKHNLTWHKHFNSSLLLLVLSYLSFLIVKCNIYFILRVIFKSFRKWEQVSLFLITLICISILPVGAQLIQTSLLEDTNSKTITRTKWYIKYKKINHILTAYLASQLLCSRAFTLIEANIKLLRDPSEEKVQGWRCLEMNLFKSCKKMLQEAGDAVWMHYNQKWI